MANVRERVRAQVRREIVAAARVQLIVDGAAGLSLRAVARELGMASSAVHRYVATRDDLLTLLIIDGYDALGSAIETAEACCSRDDYLGRWLAVARAVRGWALEHPHEYALIHGSPVAGYRAPPDTIGSAVRGIIVFGRILSDAHATGALHLPDGEAPHVPMLAEDIERVRHAVIVGVPDQTVLAALTTWTGLFGHVSFEVFGQFANTIDHPTDLFDHAMYRLGHLTGLR